ncbi:MAG: 1-acyl-sn-glycerol-3-phosphate acyltransferase [Candidatus Andersenbacteria bacterium]
MAQSRVCGFSPRQVREAVWRWQYGWAQHFLAWTNRWLDARVQFALTEEARTAVANTARPLIILANHQSYGDILLIYAVVQGRPMLWSGKKILRRLPAAGASAEVIRCAFLERGGTSGDRERMAAMARFAREDGACIMLFPEGHRFRQRRRRRSPELRNVLQPRVGGFSILLDELPGYGVLDLTIRRTAARLGGTDVVVHGRMRTVPHGCTSREQRQDLINSWWREKDHLLS